jgi:hypothetical protein
MNALHRRFSLLLVVLSLLAWTGSGVSVAQSVDAVVQQMEAQYQQQFNVVNTFVVETNHYTSYHEKVVRDGTPTYRSATHLSTDGGRSFMSDEVPSTFYGFDFDRLRQHARHGGTETISDVTAHVLVIDNPAAFNPDMDDSATRLTYYIDAKRHLPVRMRMETRADERDGPASTVVVDLTDYRVTDGLTLPYRMETQIDIAMSEKERQQMQQMMQQLKAMPERQRKQMEKMMGDRMDTMTRMVSGEPIVVEVRSVKVNTEIPAGVFSRSGAAGRSN